MFNFYFAIEVFFYAIILFLTPCKCKSLQSVEKLNKKEDKEVQ